MENLRLDNESRKISVKHRVLAEHIFYPLYQNIVTANKSALNLYTITFTASKVRDSPNYDEGLKHLKQSILNFSQQFDGIGNRINMYNQDLNDFQETGIKNAVSNQIRENGFRLPEDNDTTIIAINLSNLLPELESYWFNGKPDIEFIPNDNLVKISGGMGHAGSCRNFYNNYERRKKQD